jgi:hypothetical protein
MEERDSGAQYERRVSDDFRYVDSNAKAAPMAPPLYRRSNRKPFLTLLSGDGFLLLRFRFLRILERELHSAGIVDVDRHVPAGDEAAEE